MDNILGTSLREVRGLFKDLNDKLCGEDWQKWLEALKLFLRGEPVWTDGMIHIPLEWSPDLGEVNFALIQEQIDFLNNGRFHNWRLPTERELARALKIMNPEFVLSKYFWTSTEKEGCGYVVIRTYDGNGGLGYACSRSINQRYPNLRLCRPKIVEAF